MIKTEQDSSSVASQSLLRTVMNFEDSRSRVFISDLPVPVSSNTQYHLFRRGSKTYHAASPELKAFKKAMQEYPFREPSQFRRYKELLHQWISQGLQLEINCVVFFKEERIFTKDHRPKKLDISNRLKSLHDCIAEMFGIDDMYFFKVYAEKCICNEALGEMTVVEIRPV